MGSDQRYKDSNAFNLRLPLSLKSSLANIGQSSGRPANNVVSLLLEKSFLESRTYNRSDVPSENSDWVTFRIRYSDEINDALLAAIKLSGLPKNAELIARLSAMIFCSDTLPTKELKRDLNAQLSSAWERMDRAIAAAMAATPLTLSESMQEVAFARDEFNKLWQQAHGN